jgi:hypothetical protein
MQGDVGLQTWTTTAGGDARGQLREGRLAAARARQGVPAILADLGHDRRQFGHLVAEGARVRAAEGMAAVAADLGLADHQFCELVLRDPGSCGRGVTGLTARGAARRSAAPSLGAGLRGVGRGRLG